jgi:3',5'-cyclic AMP phosphodiesterase CpdA
MLGDFGSHDASQKEVASAMTRYVVESKLTPDWLILLGDNFYNDFGPLERLPKARWTDGFEQMYPAKTFPGPCPAVLGNHDYLDWIDGPESQLAYAKSADTRWHLPSKWYRKDLGNLATFLFIDTNTRAINSSGFGFSNHESRRFHLDDAEEAAQWRWLREQLASTRGKFTCVVGHHPVFSNGMHGDHPDLIATLAPLLRKHRVHFYFSAHDHDLQHLELESLPTSFILSGGGGAHQRPFARERHNAPFFRSVLGFSHLSLTPSRCTLRHIDSNGKLLHAMEKRTDHSWKLLV